MHTQADNGHKGGKSVIKLSEAVIVEGKYDKIKLSGIIDALIIPTDGFGIFNNKDKAKLINTLAKTRGIIIMTDPDSAGFMIRQKIRECASGGRVINVFVPDVFGKEKRKKQGSKEGKLGVEGMDKEKILSALKRAGVVPLGVEGSIRSGGITKADMFGQGLSGTPNAAQRRAELIQSLGLPEKMPPPLLLDTLNVLMTKEEFIDKCKEVFDD